MPAEQPAPPAVSSTLGAPAVVQKDSADGGPRTGTKVIIAVSLVTVTALVLLALAMVFMLRRLRRETGHVRDRWSPSHGALISGVTANSTESQLQRPLVTVC